MDYDKILLKIFLTDSGRSKYVLKKLNNYSNIKEYLDNRFHDYSESYKEILDRIKFKIEIRPTCKLCGANVKYKGLLNNQPTYKTYKVVSGDTLSGIGQKFGVSWNKIAEVNDVKPPKYIIYVGQTLRIPN